MEAIEHLSGLMDAAGDSDIGGILPISTILESTNRLIVWSIG